MNEIFGFPYLISGCYGGGIYAGATTRPTERQREHETALRNNRHFNEQFQEAVNTFGLPAFAFIWFPPVKGLEQIARAEQAIIEAAKASGEPVFNKQQKLSIHHSHGYELSQETKDRQSQARRKVFNFVSPDGKQVSTHGLREFCEAHDLTMSEMSRLAAGKINTHKGWTRAEKTPLHIEISK